MRACAFVCAVVSVVVAGVTGTLRSDPGQKAATEQIADLIKQLGDDAFVKRETASKELETIGEPALPALKKAAASSDDPETRRRAEQIIQAMADRTAGKDLKRLDGRWVLASSRDDGEKPPAGAKVLEVSFTRSPGGEHSVRFTLQQQPALFPVCSMPIAYQLAVRAEDHTIVLDTDKAAQMGLDSHLLYELDDQRLRLVSRKGEFKGKHELKKSAQ